MAAADAIRRLRNNVKMVQFELGSRGRRLNENLVGSGAVVYWMSRDQRAADNWALLYAQDLANAQRQPLRVVFCLTAACGSASLRHYNFMLTGLREVQTDLARMNIGFELLLGDAASELPRFVKQHGVGTVVCDFSPLVRARERRSQLAEALDVALIEVDAHNIVPCWLASDKQEYAARTMRAKLGRLLPHYLTDIPTPIAEVSAIAQAPDESQWIRATRFIAAPEAGVALEVPSGAAAASAAMEEFIAEGIGRYSEGRNDPVQDAQSGLSPYLHFGQLSAQRVAFEIQKRLPQEPSAVDFFDELITWRELAENHCLYNPKYNSIDGLHDWGQATLAKHADDEREFLYTLEQFERAETHDDLWNAAQLEMTVTGKMHGYMRMYWAKKILEWSPSPELAMRWAAYLNDRYELDGRDPSGYCGVAWAIGGTHDRAWREREVYGKIRYMNENGARRKFDVDAYVDRIYKLAGRVTSSGSERLFM
ncbi:MAG: deoxyribodipyrimidine photo-lyase [Thermoleophilaceae bacterium]|nr:deoxyribodipyrimidine photo-lyase [Thermoleophilaceae bacterium]